MGIHGRGEIGRRVLARHTTRIVAVAATFLLITQGTIAEETPNARAPKGEDEFRYWLSNMVWDHGFSDEEIRLATGLPIDKIQDAKRRWGIKSTTRPRSADRQTLRVLPYPGGRHPRIGFLEGAIDPQRETKFSVLAPWDAGSYVVVDLPEAIWSNLGLTYLAHTHVPTVWTKQGVEMQELEWTPRPDGSLSHSRTLPNKISFTASVFPKREAVLMKLTLTNGTDGVLTDLRVQNCVMLKGMDGMTAQTNDNKIFRQPFVACRAPGDRWVITAWQPCHRPWGNERCPCLHSDPKFPDCPPNETRQVVGWLSFFEGSDVHAELDRIEASNWAASVPN